LKVGCAEEPDCGSIGVRSPVAKLAKQHSDTAKQTESLLASLRATPRSRSTSHAAGLQTRKTAEMRPWEIRSGRRVETQTGDE
jgi:hypothetical protein